MEGGVVWWSGRLEHGAPSLVPPPMTHAHFRHFPSPGPCIAPPIPLHLPRCTMYMGHGSLVFPRVPVL